MVLVAQVVLVGLVEVRVDLVLLLVDLEVVMLSMLLMPLEDP